MMPISKSNSSSWLRPSAARGQGQARPHGMCALRCWSWHRFCVQGGGMVVRKSLGLLFGALLSPVTGLVSWVRQSRMFHPRGLLFQAEVEVLASDGAELAVARRLSGPALVRWSSAWWKRGDWPDVLGCALRFSELPLGLTPRAGDQDLLFATIRRPWTLPFAPLATDVRDFLANDYYAVSPFEVAGLGRIEWRLRAEPSEAPRALPWEAPNRASRLHHAVASGRGVVSLEYAPYRPPHRIGDTRSFRPLVRLRLLHALDLDQEGLRFDPFRAGRGIVPVGVVQWVRRLTYASSQRFRPVASG